MNHILHEINQIPGDFMPMPITNAFPHFVLRGAPCERSIEKLHESGKQQAELQKYLGK